ncbi:hypothetical protein [Buttiauxella brennerae]|nr:hypothetical protein [Buttiauxella brennerae]
MKNGARAGVDGLAGAVVKDVADKMASDELKKTDPLVLECF